MSADPNRVVLRFTPHELECLLATAAACGLTRDQAIARFLDSVADGSFSLPGFFESTEQVDGVDISLPALDLGQKHTEMVSVSLCPAFPEGAAPRSPLGPKNHADAKALAAQHNMLLSDVIRLTAWEKLRGSALLRLKAQSEDRLAAIVAEQAYLNRIISVIN